VILRNPGGGAAVGSPGLMRGSTGAISVKYSTSSAPTEFFDFTAASGTLRWEDGDYRPKVFLVRTIDDTEAEGDETFEVHLRTITGGGVLTTPVDAVVTIVDDEAGASVPPSRRRAAGR
jgi:hypothetical protein